MIVQSNRANGKSSGHTDRDECSDDDLLDTSVLPGLRRPEVGLVGSRRLPTLVLQFMPSDLVTVLGAAARLPPGHRDGHFLVIRAIPMQSLALVLGQPDLAFVRHLLLLLGILTEL